MERKPCEVSEDCPSHAIQRFTVKPSPRCRDAHPHSDMGYQSPVVPIIGSGSSVASSQYQRHHSSIPIQKKGQTSAS